MHRERKSALPAKEIVNQLLGYDPATGLLTWKRNRPGGIKAGRTAGYVNGSGYVRVTVAGLDCAAHRIAWLLMTGDWPEKFIDHINGIKSDNRWENLREATWLQNKANSVRRSDNSSGYKGIYWRSDMNVWAAEIAKNGVKYRLGTFATAEAAHEAYVQKAKLLYDEFSYSGVDRPEEADVSPYKREKVQSDPNRKVGGVKTPEYLAWSAIRKVCSSPASDMYHLYGARGIKVCDRWLENFDNFLEDVGKRPQGYKFGRKDKDGDFTPDNFLWVKRYVSKSRDAPLK